MPYRTVPTCPCNSRSAADVPSLPRCLPFGGTSTKVPSTATIDDSGQADAQVLSGGTVSHFFVCCSIVTGKPAADQWRGVARLSSKINPVHSLLHSSCISVFLCTLRAPVRNPEWEGRIRFICLLSDSIEEGSAAESLAVGGRIEGLDRPALHYCRPTPVMAV